MYDGAEEESDKSSGIFVDSQARDRRVVNVSEEEIVNWAVPIASELIPGSRVPPRFVETSIGIAGQFGEEIEDAFPNNIPGLVEC